MHCFYYQISCSAKFPSIITSHVPGSQLPVSNPSRVHSALCLHGQSSHLGTYALQNYSRSQCISRATSLHRCLVSFFRYMSPMRRRSVLLPAHPSLLTLPRRDNGEHRPQKTRLPYDSDIARVLF